MEIPIKGFFGYCFFRIRKFFRSVKSKSDVRSVKYVTEDVDVGFTEKLLKFISKFLDNKNSPVGDQCNPSLKISILIILIIVDIINILVIAKF